MRRTTMIAFGLALFGAGYFLGTADVSVMPAANAQDEEKPDVGIQVSEETARKVHDAKLALQDAIDALEVEGRYETITDGVNAFMILSGGGNAMEDLESGQGVDPETFAGLYAGQAIPEVADNLSKDSDGRLTYKGKVIRMYSQSKLEEAFQMRNRLTNPGL